MLPHKSQWLVRHCRKQELDLGDVAAIGIANQRETTLVRNRETGEPVHNAIVWQDRRTADFCERLRSEGMARWIQQRTGLLLDPYFSATKIPWILDNVRGARALAEAGKLAFGTVDTWLLWNLTAGQFTPPTPATPRAPCFSISDRRLGRGVSGPAASPASS